MREGSRPRTIVRDGIDSRVCGGEGWRRRGVVERALGVGIPVQQFSSVIRLLH